MADASELSLADELYERTGKDRGGPWETSSRFSLVAHHGTHSKLPDRNTPTISERYETLSCSYEIYVPNKLVLQWSRSHQVD